MTEEHQNIAPVRRLCEAWNKMSLGDYQAVMTADCQYINMPKPESVRVGPDVAHEMLSRYKDRRVDLEVLNIFAAGDLVCAERLETFYKAGSPTPYALPVTGVFKMRDGKIAEWRDYFDPAQIAALQS